MYKRFCLALLLLSVAAFPAWALEPGVAAKRGLASPKPEASARCEQIESKINFRLKQYEKNRDKHYTLFQGAKDRISQLVDKLANRGCDVSTVRADVTKFQSLIEEFSAAFRDFTTSMQGAREYRCGQSQGKFVGALQTARQKLTVVKQKALAVRTFYLNTLQPELKQKALSCRPSPKPSPKAAKGDN